MDEVAAGVQNVPNVLIVRVSAWAFEGRRPSLLRSSVYPPSSGFHNLKCLSTQLGVWVYQIALTTPTGRGLQVDIVKGRKISTGRKQGWGVVSEEILLENPDIQALLLSKRNIAHTQKSLHPYYSERFVL